jgi:HEAT repeat protein
MFSDIAPVLTAADVPRLGKVLLSSTSPERRAWAAQSLAEAGYISAYAYLRRALWDRDEDVRMSVVAAVGNLAVRHSAGELAALYAWSGPRLRRQIVRAVHRIGRTADFDGMLFLAAGDPDREVRALAARADRQTGWSSRATSPGAAARMPSRAAEGLS